jgi:hypothetical protein
VNRFYTLLIPWQAPPLSMIVEHTSLSLPIMALLEPFYHHPPTLTPISPCPNLLHPSSPARANLTSAFTTTQHNQDRHTPRPTPLPKHYQGQYHYSNTTKTNTTKTNITKTNTLWYHYSNTTKTDTTKTNTTKTNTLWYHYSNTTKTNTTKTNTTTQTPRPIPPRPIPPRSIPSGTTTQTSPRPIPPRPIPPRPTPHYHPNTTKTNTVSTWTDSNPS